jgi:hypothetical protein
VTSSSGGRRRWLRQLAVISVCVCTVTAGVLCAVTLLAPQVTERAYGVAQGAVETIQTTVVGSVPVVHLGAVGGLAQMDACTGKFTEMRAYEIPGVPPVWAAHNICGGDIVLTWALGQLVDIEHDGVTRRYRVVDIRYTGKHYTPIASLVGLGGQLALQSCFYGENRMKFVGLDPVQ